MRRAAALALAVAAAALGACGGDDDEKLSKGEFIARADKLCKDAQIPAPRELADARDAARFAQESLDARSELDSELRELDPPDEVRSDFEEFNAGTKRMLDLLRRMKTAADRDQEREFATAQREFVKTGDQRGKPADRIGFKSCGQPLRPPPAQ